MRRYTAANSSVCRKADSLFSVAPRSRGVDQCPSTRRTTTALPHDEDTTHYHSSLWCSESNTTDVYQMEGTVQLITPIRMDIPRDSDSFESEPRTTTVNTENWQVEKKLWKG
eukprot:gb/GECG01005565.1/.p1 GENE.gb/GECG01005565.1/~~gb/GECG01005565.1/.p1  ORF type:complete len:112 (+),score=10.32 gb/GECG01005565.1/:1-336(+)